MGNNKRKFDGYSISTIMVATQLDSSFKTRIESILEGSNSAIQRYRTELKSLRKQVPYELSKHNDILDGNSLWGTLGRYDCFSLIVSDRADFTTRAFMPNSPLTNDSTSFEYYIHTGYLLEEQGIESYYKKASKYNFVGILKIKLNPFFLTGSGHKMTYKFKEAVDTIVNKNSGYGFNVESIDYSDFVVYIFGNDLKEISEKVLEIRNLKLRDLSSSEQGIFDQSLLKKLASNIKYEECQDNHIVYFSNTTIGYNFKKYGDILKKYENENKDEDEDDFELTQESNGIIFEVNIKVKPGHISSLIKGLKEIKGLEVEEGKGNRVVFGNHDLRITINSTFKTYLEFFSYLICKYSIHIKDVSTTITSPIGEREEFNYDEKNHWDAAPRYLDKLKIPQVRTQKLRTYCNTLNISDVLQQKIYLMISTLNKELSNHINFSYFIELYEFVHEIIQSVEEYYLDTIGATEQIEEYKAEQKINISALRYQQKKLLKSLSVEDIEEELLQGVQSYELAFQNRYIKNHSTQEISDFRLSYNGGVQQIISVYDTVYKIVANFFTNEDKFGNICLVTDSFDTVSRAPTIYINYQHLFNPSLYYLVVLHESANFIYFKKERDLINKFIRNGELSVSDKSLYNSLAFYEEVDKQKMKIIIGSDMVSFDLDKLSDEGIKENRILADYLHYLLLDMLTYVTVFKHDLELFLFWNWYYFTQLSKCYTNKHEEKFSKWEDRTIKVADNKLSPSAYTTFYVRMALFSSFVKNVKRGSSDIENFLNNIDFDLKDHKLFNRFFVNDVDKDYITASDDIRKNVFRLIDENKNRNFVKLVLGDLLEELINDCSKKCGIKNDSFPNSKPIDSKLIKDVIQNKQEIYKNFQEGKPSYSQDDNDLCQVFSILHCHLKLQYDWIKKANQPNFSGWSTILKRGAAGRPILRDNKNKVLINTLGNFFILDPDLRKKITSLNNSSIESLWDLCQNFKIKLISRITDLNAL